MKKIYQLIFIFYLAAGIAVSGYFFLYPNYYQGDNSYQYEEGNEFGVSVLVTLVGCVLIGGIGYVTKKEK